jgi:hypothetical protein
MADRCAASDDTGKTKSAGPTVRPVGREASTRVGLRREKVESWKGGSRRGRFLLSLFPHWFFQSRGADTWKSRNHEEAGDSDPEFMIFR